MIFVLLLTVVACDIAGQVCFKFGVGHGEPADTGPGIFGFLLGLVHSPWILGGIAIYVVEFVVYFAALTKAPLSMAYPFNALSYCGVVLASCFVLGERVATRRWAGTLAIALGVALVCWP